MQSSSKGSIISQDILKTLREADFKVSSVNSVEKQVLEWTPVVIETNFPLKVSKHKVEYTGGDLLNNQDFPKHLQKLAGGLNIDLPLLGIKDALARMIILENL